MDRLSLPELLLRPFIDLEPCGVGPLYARGLEQYWAAFIDERRPRFALQRVLPAAFRAQFLSETGRHNDVVEDPRQMSAEFRSTRWSAICDAIDGWRSLTLDRQCRLVLLLHALCFYSVTSGLISDIDDTVMASDGDHAALAYWRASARYMLHLPDRVVNYSGANTTEIERIALVARRGEQVTLNAALKTLVHKAKIGSSSGELLEWQTRVERLVDAATANTDEFTSRLLLSRYYRAAAFVPQRQGNRAEVVRMMDLAEQHAVSMIPTDDARELLYLENLHPVIESRTKEALWLGDLDLALSRALRVVDLDPYDSKTWLELGQVRLRRHEIAAAAEAYVVAATLGPPASAIARHMAGLCYRDLGQHMLAAFFFRDALSIDPSAISPHDEIQALPDVPVTAVLKDWSLRSFEF